MAEPVHLYYFNTLDFLNDAAQLENILSKEERHRANQFLFEKDKKNYVIAHALLRKVLATFLTQSPNNLNFYFNEAGKPFLEETALQFNLSHSDHHILIGIHPNLAIGVDIEKIKNIETPASLIKMVASTEEIELFSSISEEEKSLAFLRFWTRKEAMLKALGQGFLYPSDQLSVSFQKDEPVTLKSIKNDDAKQWSLLSIEPTEETIAAIAIRHSPIEVLVRNQLS